jgi:3-hydroxybutyryl-CoA dehydrogenase
VLYHPGSEGERVIEIRTVGVIGAGTMGNGIAHVFARGGLRVVLCEVEQRFLDRGLETIRKNLGREAEKGKIALADVDETLRLIEGTLDRKRAG